MKMHYLLRILPESWIWALETQHYHFRPALKSFLWCKPLRGFARRPGYERTLLPEDFGVVDLCAVRPDHPGLFLLSQLDVAPRQPIVTDNGDYALTYKVFAHGFPLLLFTVKFSLRWEPAAPPSWTNRSTASM
jgi:hypothetical protein